MSHKQFIEKLKSPNYNFKLYGNYCLKTDSKRKTKIHINKLKDDFNIDKIPGIYVIIENKTRIVKIGESSNLLRRLDSHFTATTTNKTKLELGITNLRVSSYLQERLSSNCIVDVFVHILKEHKVKIFDNEISLQYNKPGEKILLEKFKSKYHELPILNPVIN